MQDQIAELAACVSRAGTVDDLLAVTLVIHHTREALEQQHRRMRDGILQQLADFMTAHEDDRARLRKLEREADQKTEMLAAKQEEAA